MKALVVEPGVAGSARVEDVDAHVAEAEVPVRVLELGMCGTDREIVEGLFGVAPEGEDFLVLGHEVLGVVERDGHGFARGDLVSGIVRRSCRHCLACAEGSPDSCLTGDYSERGITRLHGYARELVGEAPDQLVPIPRELGRLGVLAEPTSDCMRAIRHVRAIGGRQPWAPQRALVTGAGAIGILVTFLLRLEGFDVVTSSLEPAKPLVAEAGAEYVQAGDADLGLFDVVVECAGNAQLMADALGRLHRGGVACLIGIDGRDQRVSLDGRTIGVDTVLGNRALFGSVNARREDWLAGIDALDRMRRRWPGALEQLLGLRVPIDRFADALAYTGGKATLVLSE
ncbi:MAG: alcohol dehydrogenase catalytic domain-containing protein [Actinobacteria bacterium]|nr:alcohol dehydrogenase catalytic domain-containing protein [Actinomycetota bacterium]